MPEDCLNLGHCTYRHFGKSEKLEKNLVSTRPLKIFFSKTTQQNSWILHTNSPWVCDIKFLFKWWRHLHYQRNNSKRQFEHKANLTQTFQNLLLQTAQENSEIFYLNSPWVCSLNFLIRSKFKIIVLQLLHVCLIIARFFCQF